MPRADKFFSGNAIERAAHERTWQYDDKYGPTEELKLKSLNRLRMMRNRQTREASSIGKAPGTSAETAIDVGLTKESNFKQPGASRYEV